LLGHTGRLNWLMIRFDAFESPRVR
jgi:hypothetical protein